MAAAVALSGVGLLSTTQKPALPRTVALSGDGSLTTVQKPGGKATVALSGSGTLSATGVLSGTFATLTGGGTLAASGRIDVENDVALSGSGTLATAPAGVTSFVSAGVVTDKASGSTTVAIPYPAGLQAGDVLLLGYGANSATIVAAQTGFTTVRTESSTGGTLAPSLYVGVKYAVGTETGSYNMTVPSAAGTGQMLAIRGADQATLQDVTAGFVDKTDTSAGTCVIPSISTTKTGCALVYFCIQNASSGGMTPPTSPGTFTEDGDRVAGRNFSTGHLIWSGSGATGTVTISQPTSNQRDLAVLVAVRPAAGANQSFTGTATLSGVGGLATPILPSQMLMGCSDSSNDHGGTEEWDAWRVYTRSAMLARANATGVLRPLRLEYSPSGPPLGSSGSAVTTMTYQAIFDYVLGELNNFYYTTDTGQVHTARWGIKLDFLNGNEGSDKGILSCASNAPPNPHTPTQISNFVTSQHAIWDACHYIDPTTSQRRFPDASAGSNPTQNHELNGWVEDWLHPSAQYHDVVAFNMYPPGRGSNLATSTDPTYNWPSFVQADRTDLQDGFLIRCFYRVYQAMLQARTDTGNANLLIAIACGEVGIGDDPDDSTTRPYYAVHGLAGGMQTLAIQYGLPMPVACWWDNQSASDSPQNILTDEPAGTNPHTAFSWREWPTLNHLYGGTHPASWAGNPKSGWNHTGTQV